MFDSSTLETSCTPSILVHCLCKVHMCSVIVWDFSYVRGTSLCVASLCDFCVVWGVSQVRRTSRCVVGLYGTSYKSGGVTLCSGIVWDISQVKHSQQVQGNTAGPNPLLLPHTSGSHRRSIFGPDMPLLVFTLDGLCVSQVKRMSLCVASLCDFCVVWDVSQVKRTSLCVSQVRRTSLCVS